MRTANGSTLIRGTQGSQIIASKLVSRGCKTIFDVELDAGDSIREIDVITVWRL